MRKNTMICLCMAAFSVSTWASEYKCSGTVSGLTIEPQTGVVFAQMIGPLGWPKLCSVDTKVNGISTESCKIIYSALLTAQTAQKSVTFWFNDDKNCTQASHIPWEYLTGWYFGPTLEIK